LKGQVNDIHHNCELAHRQITVAIDIKRDEEHSQPQQRLGNLEVQMTKDQLRDYFDQRCLFMDRLRPVKG
jgi:hypothetical protein